MANVHVVAAAARTPVGLSAEDTAAAVRAGVSRVQAHPFFVDAWGEPINCGRDQVLDPKVSCTNRLTELLRSALRELADKLFERGAHHDPLPLLLALPESRPGFEAAERRRLHNKLSQDALTVITKPSIHYLGTGHAGATLGIEHALTLIDGRRAELCIVGGVDSYLDGGTLDWLEEQRLLACPAARSGFAPGEGVALLALASDAARRKLSLPSLAVLRGVAHSTETHAGNASEELLGKGLGATFVRLGRQLTGNEERFEELYCDVNGERERTTDLAFALLRASAFFQDGTSYFTAAAELGDQGAATMPLNCALAIRAWAGGYAAGKNAVVCGASWSGQRGAVLLEQAGG